ncbi:MAG: hypothetical protein LBR92_02680 [Puniceicoccales bacterium]|jgi:hypothetical protein|nr:hypothetical protein [Puniceicoccales bacterium]
MAKDRSKIILCVADESVCLCQVADQKGRAFILSSQIIQAEHFAQNKENWLREALKIFRPKLLKKVSDVLVSTTLTHYIPLEIFYLREKNFTKTTLLELEHSLGDKISQFKFGIYRTGENNIAHVFLAQKTMMTKLNEVLADAGIRKPKILLSPVMFIEESKRQTTTMDTVFLNVGRSLLSLVFHKEGEITSRLLPVKLGVLAKKISQITGQNCSEEDAYKVIKSSQKQTLDPAFQVALDEFFEGLYREIIQRVVPYFGENSQITWIVGGRHDQLYGIRQRLVKKVGQKIFSYHVAFKQQISPSIGTDIIAAMEPFIPGLLATATLDKAQISEVVNLQTDTIVIKAKTEESFFYQKFITSLSCLASALLYFSQHLNCQYIADEVSNKRLLLEKGEMLRIAKEIESVNEQIKEKKKLLGNVLVYIEQNRKWCELFNTLQNILAEAGDVYLTSFRWNTQSTKNGNSSTKGAKQTTSKSSNSSTKSTKQNLPQNGNSSSKDAKKTAPAKIAPTKIAPAKAPPAKTEKELKENTAEQSKMISTIDIIGGMFIGDVTITKDIEQEFNTKFNAIFDKIRQLPFCAELNNIKVNIPENGKITFRCTMKVNLKSKIMAL